MTDKVYFNKYFYGKIIKNRSRSSNFVYRDKAHLKNYGATLTPT